MRFRQENGNPELVIWFVIGFGIVLRIAIALARNDLIWPDEHFQTLEPAAKIVFGHGLMSWEWQQGYRSWVLPAFYMPVLFMCRLLGITGGISLVLVCRLFTALVSASSLLLLNAIGSRLELASGARFVVVAAWSLSPSILLWAPATLADEWALVLCWFALSFCLSANLQPLAKRLWFFVGLVAGLPLLAKLQTIFFALPLLCLLGCFYRSLKGLVFAMFGYGCVVLLMGLVDWWTWGAPFHHFFMQFSQGLSISHTYGISPWYDYFGRIYRSQGAYLWALFLFLLAYAIYQRKQVLNYWRRKKSYLALTFLPGICFFVVHSAIGHKEDRFILPFLPCLFVSLGVLVPTFKLPSKKYVQYLCLVGMTVLSWFSFQSASHVPLHLTSVNAIDLEEIIFDDSRLTGHGHECVVLIAHNWTWVRGFMVIGTSVEFPEVQDGKLQPELAEKCCYAIVRKKDAKILQATHRGAWRVRGEEPNGFQLYSNDKSLCFQG